VTEAKIMDQYLLSTTAELHRNDLLQEAEQARVGAQMREPHAWRHRLGEAFIRLGRRMAEEPDQRRRIPGADSPRTRTA
jgi:hypothetical protein